MRKDDSRAYLFSLACLFIVAIFCLVLVCRFFAQDSLTSPNSQVPANSTASVKVDVDLVLVNVTVTDPSNRFVMGWRKITSKFLKTR